MKVNNVVPYPESAEEATAIRMAKHHAGWVVHAHDGFFNDSVPEEDRRQLVGSAVGMFAVALLLKRFMEVSPVGADAAARELWTECDFGDSMGERVWEWLEEWGVNPADIKYPVKAHDPHHPR